jgi:aspartyl-tRNA(Asn)/glutamyl-tRNA(Gln) amidotransferase subunit A
MRGDDLIALSARAAIAAIAAGEVSAGELFTAYRRRACEHEIRVGQPRPGSLDCFTHVADDVPEMPGAGAPLAGVPLAVKDLFCTERMPSLAGSRVLADPHSLTGSNRIDGYRPPYTATAVRKLTEAGATLLGKTNQDEFAMGSSTEHSAFGPTINPWGLTLDPPRRDRVPGGSSGGSAAAVAAGLAPWALGTDTGGSIRQPAALCGIVGLKPTYGAVSRYGMIAFASSLDQAGPMARSVQDAALLLRYMAGKDPCDATSVRLPDEVALPTASDLKGVRLGVASELGAEGGGAAAGGVEPGVRRAFERTLQRAQELGATIAQIELPHASHALAAYYVLAPAEASSNLARYDGVRFGLRAEGDAGDGAGEGAGAQEGGALLDMYTRTRQQGFGAEVKRRIMLGTYALSAGYYDAYYGQAQKVRTLVARDFERAFAQVDLIVTPTTASVAFGLGEMTGDPWRMYLNDYFTVPMSLAGIPAISIPCGRSGARFDGADGDTLEGLPIGFQLAGPAFSERRVLDAAHALEQAVGFDGSGARV